MFDGWWLLLCPSNGNGLLQHNNKNKRTVNWSSNAIVKGHQWELEICRQSSQFLCQGEDYLRFGDELVTRQGLIDADVHLVASLGKEVGE